MSQIFSIILTKGVVFDLKEETFPMSLALCEAVIGSVFSFSKRKAFQFLEKTLDFFLEKSNSLPVWVSSKMRASTNST